LKALTEIALEVQRAASVSDVLWVAGAALDALGYVMVLMTFEDGKVSARFASPNDSVLTKLEEAGLGVGKKGEYPMSPLFKSIMSSSQMRFVDDVPTALRENNPGPQSEKLAAALEDFSLKTCALAPLNVRAATWGMLYLSHPDLSEADLPILRLFALQLGSAIEVAETIERLERRNAEMSLAHQLAVSGPNTDARVLCAKALTTVCLTTVSDIGVLFRFNSETGVMEMVGEPYGVPAASVHAWRSFTPQIQGWPTVRAMKVTEARRAHAELKAVGARQIAVVSLVIENQTVGLLTLIRKDDVPYGEQELQSAEMLGVQMASLLERTRLYDEARRLYGDLKKSYDELGRAQAELVRHERLAALGELAAVMAHEVRNPLGVIFNSLTTLKRLLHPTGDAEMLLNMVGEEADRLNRIVGDLLDFVRPYELVKNPIAVTPIILSAVDVATQSLGHGPRVVTELGRELPPFPVDGPLLRQALVNLIINALQATPRGGGEVVVRARVDANHGGPALIIEVEDRGPGLSPRAAEKMFQPFFTTKATGTGLGLAVVKRIVDAHLGEVTARPRDGGGTVFSVRLPGAELRENLLTPPRTSAAARSR
jgi:signal transduction histidine kinase